MPAVSGGFSRQIQKGKSRTIGSLLFNTNVCQHSLISFHCLNLSSSLSTESCTGQDLADLGDRLRDWFQLLQGNGKQNSTGNPVASSASSEALTSICITESSLLYTHNTINALHLHLYIVFYSTFKHGPMIIGTNKTAALNFHKDQQIQRYYVLKCVLYWWQNNTCSILSSQKAVLLNCEMVTICTHFTLKCTFNGRKMTRSTIRLISSPTSYASFVCNIFIICFWFIWGEKPSLFMPMASIRVIYNLISNIWTAILLLEDVDWIFTANLMQSGVLGEMAKWGSITAYKLIFLCSNILWLFVHSCGPDSCCNL